MRLNYAAFGTGIPVIAVHGWTADHRLMTGCLEPLFTDRPGYHRVYPDLPGMGGSPIGDVACSDDMLDAVDEFVTTELGDDPFLLVGDSYGGYIARGLAARRGTQVTGLALICPIGYPERSRRTLPDPDVLVRTPGLLDGLDDGEAAEYAAIAVVQDPETLRRFQAEAWPGIRIADMAALDRVSARYALAEPPESGEPFTRPAVVFAGRQDAVTGYDDFYRLLDHYPRATFAVLDRAGHNLQIEQPVLFKALMAEWLDRVAESME
ncbi:pimeloyl-ACP methyl ester carboxylesterase [Stackebrandtia albiflava]|uniref:Pimeloyl-ACP methyl ester carboxylesterase n=1 Tax=Stackebrandtia albiflava TaxID=406432 RepID=A0A562VAF4_9ACTN|nr:alpha/beta hydrolase [Stackebrandtia albiflava]TWJ14845.1 pimeloyl-ACP methyl ester carboxylesterase [Stackebrandtia albiflava]